MTTPSLRGALAAALCLPVPALAASDADIAELRTMLEQMKTQYERRIRDLESRLADAERDAANAVRNSEDAAAAAQAAAETKPMSAPVVIPAQATTGGGTASSGFGAITSGTAFNPQISAILDGNYYHDGLDGEGSALVGEVFQPGVNQLHSHDHDHAEDGHGEEEHGHSHGTADNGFNFREAELTFTATVDPYFDAALYLSVDGDGTVELEEGYFQTRSLPYGLRMKGGKFLSDFGYINRQHPHQWDFVDQNLPYLNLLGVHGLQDVGLQLSWTPDLPVYTLFGVEALQGDQEIFGATLAEDEQGELDLDSTDDGPRLFTAFAKVSPEIGENHALQLGVSYAHNKQQQLVQEHTHAHDEGDDHDDDDHGHDEEPEVHRAGLDGDASLWGLDLVYKYDGGGADGQGDFKFQTEYLRSTKDLTIRSSAHPQQIGEGRTFITDGLYAQAIYGFAPKWKAGLRYDVVGLTNEVEDGPDYGSSDRWTVDVTWSLSEFSQLRAQYARNDLLVAADERERFDAFYLQFLMSMGSHGAHAF